MGVSHATGTIFFEVPALSGWSARIHLRARQASRLTTVPSVISLCYSEHRPGLAADGPHPQAAHSRYAFIATATPTSRLTLLVHLLCQSANHSLGAVADNARVHQGPHVQQGPCAEGCRAMTIKSPGRFENEEFGQGRLVYRHTPNQAEHASKLSACERTAVSHRVGGFDEPAYYSTPDQYQFKRGHMYRIWNTANVQIHLKTFVLINIQGSKMTCLEVVEKQPKDTKEGHYAFEREHGKLHVDQDKPGCFRRVSSRIRAKRPEEDSEPLKLFMPENEAMKNKDNCWLSLVHSWHVDWLEDYTYAYCGCLDERSLARATQRYRELFNEMYGADGAD